MKIQTPTVGPIVGYTSSDQVRLWLRGQWQSTPDGYSRCFGVASIKPVADPNFGPPQYVKLTPHFDMTGICVFANLKPETAYDYRIGWFFAETEMENLDNNLHLEWNGAFTGRFRTGTADNNKSRSYAVGSCRYLLKLLGGLIFDERGDKTFGSIIAQAAQDPIDGLIMVGDQIYADDLNFIAPDKRIDEFLERYRSVFSRPLLRQLMSQVPTYMVLDDHEIEDNWPSKATNKDRINLYPHAIHSYQIYQCSHSPLFTLDVENHLVGTLNHFWYVFSDGCCDWFVMDSRTERVWDNDPNKRRMIKDDQMDALLQWLNDGSGRVKIVATSVPFFPDLKSENEDKWGGFVPERTKILDFILKNKIRKVIFLSGDVHCSMSVELTSQDDPSFKVISVVSSSFFWPYPHMSPGGFILNEPLKSSSGNTYKVVNASEIYSTDNFGRLDVSPEGVKISFFERKGSSLGPPVQRSF